MEAQIHTSKLVRSKRLGKASDRNPDVEKQQLVPEKAGVATLRIRSKLLYTGRNGRV